MTLKKTNELHSNNFYWDQTEKSNTDSDISANMQRDR